MGLYPDLLERCPKLPKTEQNNARVVLHLCEQTASVMEMMEATGYESRTSFRRKILTHLLEAGLLKPVNMKLSADMALVNARINMLYNYFKLKYITNTL